MSVSIDQFRMPPASLRPFESALVHEVHDEVDWLIDPRNLNIAMMEQLLELCPAWLVGHFGSSARR
jgi:hypothetical protein